MISKLLRPSLIVGSIFYISYDRLKNMHAKNDWKFKNYKFPPRSELVSKLKNETFDVLIIGGGATGCGVAHAASARGLSVALVEKFDFGSGTSSKSTKLIHGGVRYLQKAVFNLDKQEFDLVRESLYERKLLLKSCPNMVTPVPILLPCSSLFDFLYKSSGLALYELLSHDSSMLPTYINKEEIQKMFPFLNMNDIYKGIIYYDGQFDDARMNITCIKTAIVQGAVACNYICVTDIVKGPDFQELTLFDSESQETFKCKAKYIVNATGPYTDALRKINDNNSEEICRPSSGIHLSMSKNLTKDNTGILISESNNRVLFVLPWEGTTIVGTSDEPTEIKFKPEPTLKEIDNVLERFSVILEDKSIADRSNIKSCWSGIRPLVVDPKTKGDTATISRNHLIEVDGNFINIAGGKWTIFRKMGQDVADIICQKNSVAYENASENFTLYNSDGWSSEITEKMINENHLSPDIAQHLSHSYGVEALEIAKFDHDLTRIHPDFPYTEEEIEHICKNEYICSLEDIIARRTRLSFIDVSVTGDVLEKISNIAAKHLNWSDSKQKEEIKKCKIFIDNEMGYKLVK